MPRNASRPRPHELRWRRQLVAYRKRRPRRAGPISRNPDVPSTDYRTRQEYALPPTEPCSSGRQYTRLPRLQVSHGFRTFMYCHNENVGADGNSDHTNAKLGFRFAGPSDALIKESAVRQILGTINISKVHHDRAGHHPLQSIEIKRPELLPLGYNDQGVGTVGATVRIFAVLDIRHFDTGRLHTHGIEGSYGRTHIPQRRNQRNRRSLPHVIGVWLERQAEDRNDLVAEIPAEWSCYLSRHRPFAGVVDGVDGLHNPERSIVILRGLDECAGVLRKTRAAKAGAGVKEFRSDAIVQAQDRKSVV